jgi:hypothetical protein
LRQACREGAAVSPFFTNERRLIAVFMLSTCVPLQRFLSLFIESLPTKEEFEGLLKPLGVKMIEYRDEPRLYLMVARKS